MKKTLTLAILIISALLLTVGCGKKQQATQGKVVTVFGAFTDEEGRRFEAAIKPFTDKTGIEVRYEGTKEFESLIFVRAEGGNPPDVAALPQPGLMKRLADKGKLVPLWDGVLKKIDENYAPVWKELGTYNGKTYGLFHRVNVKSLVWYPKKAWAKEGYVPPKTWDEMKALMDKMVSKGQVPWTIGIESSGATGWAATDWLEDIMLRTAGPEAYDKWVDHKLPFNSPEVQKALNIMGEIWLNPKYVYGGTKTILTTGFGDSPKVMFDNPPKAWMHRQANFITGFFPKNIQEHLDEEVGVFGLPSIDPKYGIPVLGGGDQFVVFNDRPEVREFMEYLSTWESGVIWAKSGGALFPYKNQDIKAYPTEMERSAAELLVNAKVFRFDASDMMPAQVGAGSFWQGMVSYVGGKPSEEVLKTIDESWPK